MSGPISIVPGGYPAEFVDALKMTRMYILDYLAESLPSGPLTNAQLVDLVSDNTQRAIDLAFMMGAQWQNEHPHMPIDRKPR